MPAITGLEARVSRILTVSQDFMREQRDECSFVSLRDVERVLQVMSWFYNQSLNSKLFSLMDDDSDDSESEQDEVEDENKILVTEVTDDITKSLILAIGVCYHACLRKKEEYREAVAEHFAPPCKLVGGAAEINDIITRCQDAFLENVNLGANIARNQALKENVFMMVTCIELRIPLFLVGKPGSSKSLAKTIVADAMQGNAAHHVLFKEYKAAQMVSFQCSPLSTPEGIVGTFRQCAQFQKDKDLDRFVSVVVLDEVGLAEDSPRMPLKTLHPLLEDGCQGDEKPEPHMKVAFIGISNWALDPAKMNRGIFVQRFVPDKEELIESAEGICSTKRRVLKLIKPLIPDLAESYLALFEKALELREFFGLRDFYSLLKMVYAFAEKKIQRPTWRQLEHAIRRNFGGLDKVDPVEVFATKLVTVRKDEDPQPNDPDCTPAGLIEACLTGGGQEEASESRYLLLLTENYGALSILQQKILKMHNAITIFGSSFPSDQEYTQVCRNINRIKVCMETGSTVVLLNLENLYESLYDALNQYYVEFGGERYVDLGLGTHRVKCRVHKKFRLIVVAEKQIVYDKFPIPLINRLEKHFLTLSTMLTPIQQKLVKQLEKWAQDFVTEEMKFTFQNIRGKKSDFSVGDVFMGYHADTCASVILHVSQDVLDENATPEDILSFGKEVLLWCVTPDAVERISSTKLQHEEQVIARIYWKEQQHESLLQYLYLMVVQKKHRSLHTQITTHSKLISTADLTDLSNSLNIPVRNLTLLTLQSFDTEQQFCRQIRSCFENHSEDDKLLIVQCDCGDQNASLVACARYCIQDELSQIDEQYSSLVHVVFIIQLPRIAGGCFTGFQCGRWHSVHIDDLRPPDKEMPTIMDMRGQSVGTLLSNAVSKTCQETATDDGETKMDWQQLEEHEEDRHMEVDEPHTQLRLDDIILETEVVNKLERRFDVRTLILACIQSALSMVKDQDKESSRTTDRVKILLSLLHEHTDTGHNTFVNGLGTHLAALLMEKEEKFTTAQTASKWLSQEAAKAENINRAGTFRRAWMQCLETKITPILAGIIAHLDTNRNLDILAESKPDDWQHILWLYVSNNPRVTKMEYALLVSPMRQQNLEEIIVKNTGVDGQAFTSKMPFSWLIYKQIEEGYKATISTQPEADQINMIKKTTDVLQSTALGRILQTTLNTYVREAVKAYLSDFVYMVYHVKSEEEHQLVCEAIINTCYAMNREEFDSPLTQLVSCHIVYSALSMRLTNFSNITRAWPDCCKTIIKFQQKSPHHYLVSNEEMTLDILALHLMLEQLEPNKDALNKATGRQEWLHKVHSYRPIAERILGSFTMFRDDIDDMAIGRRCKNGVDEARRHWSRVVLVKLFIEHVCSMSEMNDSKRCMPMWIMFKDGADMKKKESLDKLEKLLKLCNKDAVTKYFGKQSKCELCESETETRSITLPCKDVICQRCYNDLMIMEDHTCPVCRRELPPTFNPNSKGKLSKEVQKYKEYKSRCNSFFMEVVSQLCFAEETPPSEQVVDRLLQYITYETRKGDKVVKVVSKELTIFDDCIDATPVVRSFLLQLLMRTSGDKVDEYLQSYLRRLNQLLEGDKQQRHFQELCLLILQCIEDSYQQDISGNADHSQSEMEHVTELLRNAKQSFSDERISVHKLYGLAQARFGLTVVAKYIYKYVVEKTVKLTPDLRRLIDAAAGICEDCGSNWPRKFFVKYFCRSYGVDSYQTICTKQDARMLKWITLPELQGTEIPECSDRYIFSGPVYQEFREKITQSTLGDVHLLQDLLDKYNNSRDWKVRVYLLLALHRDVTMANIYPKNRKQLSTQAVGNLQEVLAAHPVIKDQNQMVTPILQNELWRDPQRNIHEGMDLKRQNIVCLLTHMKIVFSQVPNQRSVLEPLIRLANHPFQMRDAFLPTMPQDDIEEVKEALLAARQLQGGSENPVFHRNHLFHNIFCQCGRAGSVGICKDCGAEIGGVGHQLRPGNVIHQGIDQTATGHILGRAQNRKHQAAPERTLTPAQCAVLRLLTHLSLYIGADSEPVAVCGLVKPDLQHNVICQFMWDHIETDIACLKKALGRSVDDVFTLLHYMLARIVETFNQAEVLDDDICGLKKKDVRIQWEKDFTSRIIIPTLQGLDAILREGNNTIVNDKRLGKYQRRVQSNSDF
ncbi:hypothetical protein KUTeg_007992 [Tegillarca granosa]|uniref:RING-type E3 ubiquitin transferase n=1 Tax=Tegillarca granosa TaxID=220873 RepID=A0ABQ9FH47_TEGGR|nr:hypothetical protein KUTeg_007992 [Tegillarca granosa]